MSESPTPQSHDMSDDTDPTHLDPGGLWRCDSCGGLVPKFGVLVCNACIWPTTPTASPTERN